MNSISKEAFLSLFGDKICPPLSLAFFKDPMTPDHQLRLAKYDLEGKSLRAVVAEKLMDLTDGNTDRSADCLITSLTHEGLEFFLPLFIYYFMVLQEREAEFSYHFASTIYHSVDPELGVTEVFDHQELQVIAAFFKSIMNLDVQFSRDFPATLSRLETHVDTLNKKRKRTKYQKGASKNKGKLK